MNRAAPNDRVPTVALTSGDVRGIGPEVLFKALARQEFAGRIKPLVVGPAAVMRMQAAEIWSDGGYPELVAVALDNLVDIAEESNGVQMFASMPGLRTSLDSDPALAGRWAGRAVQKAVELISGGDADSLVTAPLDKHALNLGGYKYPGHTELLAKLAGGVDVSMMLAGGSLRVVPATTHVPLSRVPSLVTRKLIVAQCHVIDRGLREVFGIGNPRIAVCGLNPHLGDGGVAGDEDQRITAPAVGDAVGEGLDVRGPFPADTVFVRAVRGEFDAVLAMYHDQAMVAIKMHSFGAGVNITLGLPFVRTSPDHGTALDIAGRGVADEGSMAQALKLAVDSVLPEYGV